MAGLQVDPEVPRRGAGCRWGSRTARRQRPASARRARRGTHQVAWRNGRGAPDESRRYSHSSRRVDPALRASRAAGSSAYPELAIRRPTGSSTTTERPSIPEILPASSSIVVSPPALSKSVRPAPWESSSSPSSWEKISKSRLRGTSGVSTKRPTPSAAARPTDSAGTSPSSRQTTAGEPKEATSCMKSSSRASRAVTATSSAEIQPLTGSSTASPRTCLAASPGSGQSASNSCRRIREKSFRITAGSVRDVV